jgi:FKBP-type peptidyl-prolyl cis-trans isomerase
VRQANASGRPEVDGRFSNSMARARRGLRSALPLAGVLVVLAGCGYPDPYAGQGGPEAVVAATTATPSPGQPGQDQFSDGANKRQVKFPDGLRYSDITVGKGALAQKGSKAQVQYTLFLSNGTRLQSSRDSGGQGFQVTLDTSLKQAIPGFVEGVTGMRVGGKRRLVIPPSLGYGPQGQPPQIPANATLVFIVEVVSVVPAVPTPAPSPTPSASPSPSPTR